MKNLMQGLKHILSTVKVIFPPLWYFYLIGVKISKTRFYEVFHHVCMHAQSFLTLCDPMDYSRPGSSVHGIILARILEWVAISSSRGSSSPRDLTHVSCDSCIDRQILYHWATWKPSIIRIGKLNTEVSEVWFYWDI